MAEKKYLSLTELTDWMSERGVKRSRAEWYRRIQAGQFGEKIGSQWVVSVEEAQAALESFRPMNP